MNKYVKISIAVLCFFSQELFSQPTISSSIDAVDLVCPDQMVEYKVSYPTGTRQCSVTWSFESGSGHYLSGYSSTSNPTRVTWDETKPNKVKISVAVN
jgi:hypothetical protein